MTPCVERTYINLGKRKGKQSHVNTIINYSAKKGNLAVKYCYMNQNGSTASATPQSGVATLPSKDQVSSVQLAPIQPVSNRQDCVAQMHPETQLKVF